MAKTKKKNNGFPFGCGEKKFDKRPVNPFGSNKPAKKQKRK